MSTSVRAWLAGGLAALIGAAALHLLVLAGVGAVWAAMIHLTLFGWISALIVGVTYHTLPVFTGRDVPFPALIWAHAGLFGPGLVLSTAGMALGIAPVAQLGLALESGAALLFAANLVLLLTRGRPRAGSPIRPALPDIERVERAGIGAALVASFCAPLALALLLGARAGWIGGAWMLAAEHLAALGWLMLMVVSVAIRALPRFSGRGVRGIGWVHAQLACHLAALALIVPALGWGSAPLFAAGGLLMAAATALLAWTIWPTLRAITPGPAHVAVSPPAAKGGVR